MSIRECDYARDDKTFGGTMHHHKEYNGIDGMKIKGWCTHAIVGGGKTYTSQRSGLPYRRAPCQCTNCQERTMAAAMGYSGESDEGN